MKNKKLTREELSEKARDFLVDWKSMLKKHGLSETMAFYEDGKFYDIAATTVGQDDNGFFFVVTCDDVCEETLD